MIFGSGSGSKSSFVSSGRYLLIGLFTLFAFSAIGARLCYLHVWKQDTFQRIVERSRHKFQVLESRRGDIVDATGNLLATTEALVELGVDPQMVREEDDAKWAQLAELLKLDLAEIKTGAYTKIIEKADGSPYKPRWKKLAEGIDDAMYDKVMALGIRGVYGNRKYERVYPGKELAAHVVGYINKEYQAVTGVEYFMNFYLKGQDGWLESERDGRRRELLQFRTREVEPYDGYHVELTINSAIQNIIEEEVKAVVKQYDPESVSIIVSDPATGYILGLANYPSYDPNAFWKYDIDMHRNRAVTDIFEPGSTFKIVTACGSINEGVLDLQEHFDCRIDRVKFNGRMVHLPKDHRPMDILTGREVIAKSSNRGMAQIAMRLGSHKLYAYARAFGFGEKTGYGPSGEVRGILHPVSEWDGLTISRMPMGHAISATPMQVHYAMSVLANGGVLMEPQVIRRVFDDANRTVTTFPPKPKRRVVKSSTLKTVLPVVQEATHNATIRGYSVASKSGTTQKIIRGKYSTSLHVASCSGFFPAERPQVAITVVVDAPKLRAVGYGNVVAAPVFKRIGEQLIQYMAIPSDEDFEQLLASK